MLDGTKHFDCTCGSPQHTLRFVLDLTSFDDVHIPTIYTEIQMSHYLPWYKRIWVAIKYIFGYDTIDHYGCWELDHNDADRMISMLTQLKEANDKYLSKKKIKIKKSLKTKPNKDEDEHLYGGNDYEQST